MPVYDYTALSAKGKTLTGIIDAESAAVAKQKLRAGGSYPVSIEEASHRSKAIEGKAKPGIGSIFSRVRTSDVSMMTRQLSTLVGAGFPLVSALEALVPQTKSQGFVKVIAQLKEAIVEGNSFASALSRYPSIFSNLYINMVKAGESSGTLEIVLERLADITEKQQALKSRIRAAMAYPIFMALIGAAVLVLLLTFIVPNITSIFTDMGKALPTPTLLLISVSTWLTQYWWLLLLLIIAAAIGLRMVRKTDRGAFIIDRMVLRVPLFGSLVRRLTVARFTRTLGSLLQNGVSMLIALDIARGIAGNRLISEAIEAAAVEVEKGRGLGRSLGQADTFPHLAVQMIEVGEHSGDLEEMLIKIADVYEREVESSVMSITSLMEPLMILGMALVVGFIVLSICLPIFEMNQLVV
ncbi:MAG: type II secretion system inner membrane protein GspF [Desulfosarcinaceae bacterium]|nr:type II secretion system inner membrane protein GspF [Desulfosarcinaceae bacterium]